MAKTKLEQRNYNGVNWYYLGVDYCGNTRILVDYTQFLTAEELAKYDEKTAKQTAFFRAHRAGFDKWNGKKIYGFVAHNLSVSDGSPTGIVNRIINARNK